MLFTQIRWNKMVLTIENANEWEANMRISQMTRFILQRSVACLHSTPPPDHNVCMPLSFLYSIKNDREKKTHTHTQNTTESFLVLDFEEFKIIKWFSSQLKKNAQVAIRLSFLTPETFALNMKYLFKFRVKIVDHSKLMTFVRFIQNSHSKMAIKYSFSI